MGYNRRHKRICLGLLLALLVAMHPLLGHTAPVGYIFCLESNGRLRIETSNSEMSCDILEISQPMDGTCIVGSSFCPSLPTHCNGCVDLPYICQDGDRTLNRRGAVVTRPLMPMSKPELILVVTTRERSRRVTSLVGIDSSPLTLLVLTHTNLLI